ncbi:hypothetical protein WOLCODRAFT_103999 [Wolfiporia cocos MD-104 SS10]|uniref:Uncharacterized protein n=1 Tax=Wolfiporia cocos (strain MD-104) TaxID=742152 RepID=A0A2H3JP77_WOLCO|nr:hypothetical protein WOLCODRAFT_103999 [Wolfiporia cocos MD-104 SS10]
MILFGRTRGRLGPGASLRLRWLTLRLRGGRARWWKRDCSGFGLWTRWQRHFCRVDLFPRGGGSKTRLRCCLAGCNIRCCRPPRAGCFSALLHIPSFCWPLLFRMYLARGFTP